MGSPSRIEPGCLNPRMLAIAIRADSPLESPAGHRFQVVQLLLGSLTSGNVTLIADALPNPLVNSWVAV